MMKEVEVGDEYVGKVVKTTTFGAFIELAKGTDGLLHISNVSPGERVETRRGRAQQRRRDQRARGRGRPRARPHRPAPRRRPGHRRQVRRGARRRRHRRRRRRRRRPPRDGGGRNGRSRRAARGATATAAPAARAATATEALALQPRAPDNHAGLRRAGRHRAHAERALGGARLLDRHRLGRRVRRRRRASRTCSSTCCSAAPSASARRRSTRSSTRWARRSTRAPTRNRRRCTRACSTATCERAFEVMGDMVWHPRFGELETEREVVLEEIAMYEDDPQDRVFDVLGEAVFGAHPLGRAVIGTAEVVGAVTREQLAAFHAARYAPQKIVIAAAGSVDHDALVEMVDALDRARARRLAARRRRAPSARGWTRARRTSRAACASSRKTPSSTTCASAAPGIARDDERRFALRVLEGMLGGTSSSRLFQEVRERRGLAYSVFSYSNLYAHTGEIGLYVGTRPENLERGARGDRRRAARAASPTRPPRRSSTRSRENLKGRVVLVDGVDRRAHEPARRLAAARHADPLDRRGDRAHRRRHASTTCARSPASCSRPSALSIAGVGPDERLFETRSSRLRTRRSRRRERRERARWPTR